MNNAVRTKTNYQDWLVTEMLQSPSYQADIDKVIEQFFRGNRTPQEALELGHELKEIYECAELDHDNFPCDEECCAGGQNEAI